MIIFSMLHSSEQSDANCFRSTNASKLLIDIVDEPLEKNSDSEVVCLSQHEGLIGGTLHPRFL